MCALRKIWSSVCLVLAKMVEGIRKLDSELFAISDSNILICYGHPILVTGTRDVNL